MLKELVIPKKPQRDPAMDHERLYLQGLERARDLSKQLWTDYNVHDPGVTILEFLCYALTDLGYRSSMPIADLLASPEDNRANMQQQFFSAREILTAHPLTELDYRKLLIDLVGVKNAWIRPAPLRYYADILNKRLGHSDSGQPGVIDVDIRGLYEVRIDFMDGLRASQRAEVLAAAAEILHANRNLCEDFVGFTQVGKQDWIVCGEFELEPEADIAEVKAQILFQVQDYLAPAVANYSLDEMLEKRRADGSPCRAEDIFSGPRLNTGFIVDEELVAADLRSEVRLSDVINIVMDIPGVSAVRDIQINPRGLEGPLENKWVVAVADGKKALLHRDGSRLVFYKRNMPMAAREDEVDARLEALAADARAKLETDIGESLNFPIPLGRYRNPGTYYALQNHLPAIYGVGENGLPGGADADRVAQSRQLKAYLLFFEQLLADFLAQLAHLRDLFSTDPEKLRADFHQVVDSFVDWQLIYGGADDDDDDQRRKILHELLDALDDGARSLARRNRFLDHLIGRYAERFNEFAAIMYSSFGIGGEALVRYKCRFLRNYPALSSARGIGYNYSLDELGDIWNSHNVSGLERRLGYLLGIDNPTRRNLGDVAYDIYAEIDLTPGDEFRFRIRNRDDGDILLSSSRNFVTRDDARAEMRRAILYGTLPGNYRSKVGSNGKLYFTVVDNEERIVAARRQGFDDEAEMQQAIDEIMEYLRVNYSEEGLYLIENILLRPEQSDDPFLPICVDSNCDDCAEADPYSYRIHIILPAYGARFRDQDFRAYAERVIRAEVPAHILPKICWISKEDMAAVEKTYQDWIKLKCGRTRAGRRQKIQRFIDALNSAKNVYPVERLHECDGEQREKFVLGRKALGSFEP